MPPRFAVVGGTREVQVRRVHDAGRQARQHVGRAVAERQLPRSASRSTVVPLMPGRRVQHRGAFATTVIVSSMRARRHRDVDAQHVTDADRVVRRVTFLKPVSSAVTVYGAGVQIRAPDRALCSSVTTSARRRCRRWSR